MKFIIETYGCQMNVADSETITAILSTAGFIFTSQIAEADIIIFNTCSVRENAEQRVIGRISNEVSRKLSKPLLLVGIVGCMAQRLGEKLNIINKKIDFVVGVDQYLQLPEIINNCALKKQFYSILDFDIREKYSIIEPFRSNNLQANITIMRGCNNFCSYCIVPYTRGRERSRNIHELLKEIENVAKNEILEIIFLGQNVNSYCFFDDLEKKEYNFSDLLQMVNSYENIKRIRFITSHPKDLSETLITTMASCKQVCEHIHLPLQSGNNEILARMNRNYTVEHYLDIISKLRKAIPNIAITTDVIAGFPGETSEQFIDTLKIMDTIQFDFAYMFKYSERSGTKAASFADIVPEEIRLDRLQQLIDQQTAITTKKYKSKINNTEEIYVEAISKRNPHELSGKTRDFKITVFEGDKSLIGKLVTVKIVDAIGWTLKGKIK